MNFFLLLFSIHSGSSRSLHESRERGGRNDNEEIRFPVMKMAQRRTESRKNYIKLKKRDLHTAASPEKVERAFAKSIEKKRNETNESFSLQVFSLLPTSSSHRRIRFESHKLPVGYNVSLTFCTDSQQYMPMSHTFSSLSFRWILFAAAAAGCWLAAKCTQKMDDNNYIETVLDIKFVVVRRLQSQSATATCIKIPRKSTSIHLM